MKRENIGDAALERLKIALQCKNLDQVAQRLGVPRKLLSETRKSGRLPEAVREKNIARGINPFWVETGLGQWRVRECNSCVRLLLHMAAVVPEFKKKRAMHYG